MGMIYWQTTRSTRRNQSADPGEKGQREIRRGVVSTYEISRLLYGLREPGNREACRTDPEAYYRRYDLFESERQLLLKPDWQGLVDAGVSIYLLTKLGATLNVDLLEVGASMRGMPREEFLRLIKEQGERNRKYAVLLE